MSKFDSQTVEGNVTSASTSRSLTISSLGSSSAIEVGGIGPRVSSVLFAGSGSRMSVEVAAESAIVNLSIKTIIKGV